MQLGRRLALQTLDGDHLAGAPTRPDEAVERILYSDGDQDEGEGGVSGENRESIGDVKQPFAKLVLYRPLKISSFLDNAFLIEQFRVLLLVSLFALVFSGVAAFVLARSLTSRVRLLVQGTKQLKSGDYSFRLAGNDRDEIGSLQTDFNALAESLEAAEKAERQWISDASHELKTPLAILKGRLEGLQDGIYRADDKLLVEMLQTVDRLNMLVSDLNMLAHAREGKLLCRLWEENLSELVSDAVQHVSARFATKGLSIEVDLPPQLLVKCDRNRIRQLLDNLLENSRRYTDAPGQVRITGDVHSDGRGIVRLVVEDSAPHPESEEIERLFERFYRTDPSRARQSGGSGLGLAICRAIVKAHEGQISARPSDLGGLAVDVMLPVSPRPQDRNPGEANERS
ncbi:ATP-binding protein [uncultured Cohaesibacter sp.]|uniref:ATP-binding protein n=1 Tax=uncultured Cohaesibacter sp. TaxID=1002546 RepID=UPI0029C7F756|nr:ATP-binding protein [uncultured Cohaesibacter sp.]